MEWFLKIVTGGAKIIYKELPCFTKSEGREWINYIF